MMKKTLSVTIIKNLQDFITNLKKNKNRCPKYNGPHDDNEEDNEEGEDHDEACGKNDEEIHAEEAAEAAEAEEAAEAAATVVLITLPKSNCRNRLK